MPQMTDPFEGLVGFQEALRDKLIVPEQCRLHPDMVMLRDNPEGHFRLTYAIVVDNEVRATAVYVVDDDIDGDRCFGIGYAVAEKFRRQGLANEIVEKSIGELKQGLKNHLKKFYIEALVAVTNSASQRVAARHICHEPRLTTEQHSGEPAFAYTRMIET